MPKCQKFKQGWYRLIFATIRKSVGLKGVNYIAKWYKAISSFMAFTQQQYVQNEVTVNYSLQTRICNLKMKEQCHMNRTNINFHIRRTVLHAILMPRVASSLLITSDLLQHQECFFPATSPTHNVPSVETYPQQRLP